MALLLYDADAVGGSVILQQVPPVHSERDLYLRAVSPTAGGVRLELGTRVRAPLLRAGTAFLVLALVCAGLQQLGMPQYLLLALAVGWLLFVLLFLVLDLVLTGGLWLRPYRIQHAEPGSLRVTRGRYSVTLEHAVVEGLVSDRWWNDESGRVQPVLPTDGHPAQLRVRGSVAGVEKVLPLLVGPQPPMRLAARLQEMLQETRRVQRSVWSDAA